MIEQDKKDLSSSSVGEPEAVYASQSAVHQAPMAIPTEVSREDRMTVDEFCNMLHQYVDEYYDNIQG